MADLLIPSHTLISVLQYHDTLVKLLGYWSVIKFSCKITKIISHNPQKYLFNWWKTEITKLFCPLQDLNHRSHAPREGMLTNELLHFFSQQKSTGGAPFHYSRLHLIQLGHTYFYWTKSMGQNYWCHSISTKSIVKIPGTSQKIPHILMWNRCMWNLVINIKLAILENAALNLILEHLEILQFSSFLMFSCRRQTEIVCTNYRACFQKV